VGAIMSIIKTSEQLIRSIVTQNVGINVDNNAILFHKMASLDYICVWCSELNLLGAKVSEWGLFPLGLSNRKWD